MIQHVRNEEFLEFETFPGPQIHLRDPRSRADAQQILYMARRTGFREQYYTGTRKYYCAGKIGASNPVKLCVTFGQFFFDNFGLTNSFGLGLCMQRDMIILHQWKLVRCPGKSMRKILSGIKVILHIIKMKNFSIWRRLRPQK